MKKENNKLRENIAKKSAELSDTRKALIEDVELKSDTNGTLARLTSMVDNENQRLQNDIEEVRSESERDLEAYTDIPYEDIKLTYNVAVQTYRKEVKELKKKLAASVGELDSAKKYSKIASALEKENQSLNIEIQRLRSTADKSSSSGDFLRQEL